MLSWYVVQVFTEWFWDGSNCLITGITFVFTFHMHAISVVRSYITESSQLLSWSHFCLQNLQHLLTYMFIFHYHGLTVQFLARDGSVSLLFLFHNVVTLTSWYVSANIDTWSTSVHCLILPPFPWICYNAVEHTFYHVTVFTVLSPLLVMLIQCGLLSCQIVDVVCICCDIFVSWYFDHSSWSCASVISVSVSAFRCPLDSHRNIFLS